MSESDAVLIKPKDYKTGIKPIWCPGCGDFAVLSAVTKAMAWKNLAKEDTALLSGIGCSSRLPAYVDSYGFHGIHGRVLPLASGLKVARPELTVIAVGGDGDGYSIGGNHFMHACRRNIDMTYIVMDNRVYGMTKGQASPTTAADWNKSKLTPHGTGIPPFQPLSIALAAGAGFIARGFSGDPKQMTRLIVEAIEYPGFALIEVLSPCPTFRPEQKEWKHQVRQAEDLPLHDPVQAAQWLAADDGMSSGLIYQREHPVWQPRHEVQSTLSEIEQEFSI
jgi:2-oxoglutarate ferredoxin oxidoreductase subunit beta